MIDNYYSISDLAIKTHLISTVIMVGAIWVIQLLHYPSSPYVEKNNYARFNIFTWHEFFLISGFFSALLYDRKSAREMITI